jgi:hypothetical protein
MSKLSKMCTVNTSRCFVCQLHFNEAVYKIPPFHNNYLSVQPPHLRKQTAAFQRGIMTFLNHGEKVTDLRRAQFSQPHTFPQSIIFVFIFFMFVSSLMPLQVQWVPFLCDKMVLMSLVSECAQHTHHIRMALQTDSGTVANAEASNPIVTTRKLRNVSKAQVHPQLHQAWFAEETYIQGQG